MCVCVCVYVCVCVCVEKRVKYSESGNNAIHEGQRTGILTTMLPLNFFISMVMASTTEVNKAMPSALSKVVVVMLYVGDASNLICTS